MLSLSESENFYTLDSLKEKLKKEKNDKAIQILNSYIDNIKLLTNDIKKKENLLLYYNLKLNKIKDEYDEINNEIIEEENNLIDNYISSVENEEFYISPPIEIRDICERAKAKKNKYDKILEEYEFAKYGINKEESQLEEEINNLPEKEKNIYNILKQHLLYDKNLNQIRDYYNLLSENDIYEEIIRENMTLIKDIKNRMRNQKNELNDIRKEIKNNKEKKARKNINHLNYNDNISISKNNNYINNSYDNINTSMINNSNNSFIFNDDLNKTDNSFLNKNNISTNLNKTYYLRANKSLNNISKNNKMKSYTLFLKTDSSEKNRKRDLYLCKRLLNNYCNKYSDKNKDFIFDMKLK